MHGWSGSQVMYVHSHVWITSVDQWLRGDEGGLAHQKRLADLSSSILAQQWMPPTVKAPLIHRRYPAQSPTTTTPHRF